MEILVGAFLFLMLVVLFGAVLWWRFASSSNQQNVPQAAAPTNTSPDLQAPLSTMPPLKDALEGSGSKQVKGVVSKHALKIERKGDRTLYWFDGVPFGDWKEIPDATVREQARQMLAQIGSAQAGLEYGLPHMHYVVNGVSYNSLAEISDPRLRQAVEEAMKKAEP
jgi:hypothetical protein